MNGKKAAEELGLNDTPHSLHLRIYAPAFSSAAWRLSTCITDWLPAAK